MRKVVSRFLSALFLCLVYVSLICQPVFASSPTEKIVRFPIVIDATTVQGGICWFSYYLEYPAEQMKLLYIENEEDVFNNNASPAIPANQSGRYLITMYRTGEQMSSLVTLIDVNGAVAQGCVDYIDPTASAPVTIAYAYFSVSDDTAVSSVTFTASEKGGGVRAGTNSGVQPIILGAEGTGTTAPMVEMEASSTMVTDISVSLDDPNQSFQQAADDEMLSAVLKHMTITVTLSDGSVKDFDLADSELALGTDYQAVYTPPAEGTDMGTVSITFWDCELSSSVHVSSLLVGDLNENGTLERNDYTRIRQFFGGHVDVSTITHPEIVLDANSNGVYNRQDYTIFRQFFGGHIDSLPIT